MNFLDRDKVYNTKEEEKFEIGSKLEAEEESYRTMRANSGSSVDFFHSSPLHYADKRELIHSNISEKLQLTSPYQNNKFNSYNESLFKPNSMQAENIKQILFNLYRSLELNRINKSNLVKNYETLTQRQTIIETTLEKIKRVNRAKQKKHVKYLRYIPLNKIYFYSPKKNHFYYILMDIVVKSRKKIGDKKREGTFTFDDEEDEPEKITKNRSKTKKKNSESEKINKSTLKRSLNRNKFSEEEDDILKKLILYTGGEYIDWQQIAKDLNDFLARVMNTSKTRTPLECYTRSLEISDFYTYKKWTNNEDQILKKAILYYGPKNWQQISYCLEGRNNSQAFHRWMKGINPKIKRSKWSFEEDLTLGIALKIYGNKKWSKIANHLGGRTDIQCRERFCNILDPSLEEVEWKPHEDAKLLLLYDKMKNKWSKIAKEFGNRTDNTCWRRWKYLESIRKNMRPNSGMNRSLNMTVNSGPMLYSASNITNNSQTILDTVSEPNPNDYSESNIGKNLSKRKKKKEIFKVRKMPRFESDQQISDFNEI